MKFSENWWFQRHFIDKEKPTELQAKVISLKLLKVFIEYIFMSEF